MPITAKQGQSFIDLVLQSTGNMENIVAMAIANDVSITDVPNIGDTLQVEGTIKTSITALLESRYMPASVSRTDEPAALDYMMPQTLPIV